MTATVVVKNSFLELEHEVASTDALCGTARSRSLSDGCLHLSSCKLHEKEADVMSESTECEGSDPLGTFDSLDSDDEALLTFSSMKSENETEDVEVCSVCSLDDDDDVSPVSPVTPGTTSYAMFQYVPCCMTMIPVTNAHSQGQEDMEAQRPSRSSRRRRARATKRIQGCSEWSSQAQLLLQQTEWQSSGARTVAQPAQPLSGVAWTANIPKQQRWADTEVEPTLVQTQGADESSSACDETFNQLKGQLDDLLGKWCSHSDNSLSGRFSCHTVAGHVKIPVNMQVGY